MSDIILEIIRAVITGLIFVYLVTIGKNEDIRRQNGWTYIIAGFGFIFFGTLIDITDNFSTLDKFIIIGDTEYQAFLEKVVGYLLGFALLAIGFIKWIPIVIALKQTRDELERSNNEMESRVEERTLDLSSVNKQLEEEIIERKQAEKEKEQVIVDLKKALTEVKALKGLIPICATCKMIRDDKGYWNQVEHYISEHSEAEFTHGICPGCADKMLDDAKKFDSNKNKN